MTLAPRAPIALLGLPYSPKNAVLRYQSALTVQRHFEGT